MFYRKYLILILILLFGAESSKFLHAQPATPVTSFEKDKAAAVLELKKYPRPDTNRVNALLNILGTPTYRKEREAVIPYRLEAFELSKKINFNKGIVTCYISAGGYQKSASNYQEALRQYDSALLAAGTDPSVADLRALALERKGMIYYEQGNYYAALDNLFEALRFQEIHSTKRTTHICLTITDIYITLNNMESAEEYGRRCEKLLEQDTSRRFANSVYFNMTDISMAKNDYKKANEYLDKVAPTIPDPEEVQVSFGYYLKKGDLSTRLDKYQEALGYYDLAYKYAIQGGHKRSKNAALQRLASTSLKLNDLESAKKYSLENMELAEEINTKAEKIGALTNLSQYYKSTGNLKLSVDMMQQAIRLKDSLVIENNSRQMNILAAIYETEKQNKQISSLQQEKDRETANAKYKSTVNRFLIGATIFLLILGYLGFSNFRNRQKLAEQQQTIQRQKIIELEKDKQLLTVDGMLKGQEEERNRIAKDLHDGLGSLLSGTKLSFMNVKENLLLSPIHATMFDKSLSMLDNTISDLRKVAHNLMPEGLVKFGLQETLKDFCEAIQSTTGVKILYQQYGEERRLDSTAEVFIYRIVQELVNNAIKHSGATEILVQLTLSATKTSITVEDNGRGFDASILSQARGAGMSNIQYRMQYFHGTMDLVTAPGKGTSVNLELIA